MSIQEHLNKIRNAVYGHEVRESIAKGIETAYDDASEKDNANMEVKIARGTHPNLRSRLDETTAQLAHKATKDDLSNTNMQVANIEYNKADKTTVWRMENMGQDVKQAMTGDSVAVVGENSVLNENIVNEQVSIAKLEKPMQEKLRPENVAIPFSAFDLEQVAYLQPFNKDIYDSVSFNKGDIEISGGVITVIKGNVTQNYNVTDEIRRWGKISFGITDVDGLGQSRYALRFRDDDDNIIGNRIDAIYENGRYIKEAVEIPPEVTKFSITAELNPSLVRFKHPILTYGDALGEYNEEYFNDIFSEKIIPVYENLLNTYTPFWRQGSITAGAHIDEAYSNSENRISLKAENAIVPIEGKERLYWLIPDEMQITVVQFDLAGNQVSNSYFQSKSRSSVDIHPLTEKIVVLFAYKTNEPISPADIHLMDAYIGYDNSDKTKISNADLKLNLNGLRSELNEIEIKKNKVHAIEQTTPLRKFIAHGGAQHIAPEMSMEAYELCKVMGYWGIEGDAQLTKDDDLIVMHDATLDRSTDGTGDVVDYTVDEIKQFNITANASLYDHDIKVPTMDEMLLFCKNNQLVPFIEIKSYAVDKQRVAELLISKIKYYNLVDSAVIMSFSWSILETVRSIDEDVWVSQIYTGQVDQPFVDKALNIGNYIHFNYNGELVIDESQMRLMRDNNIPVFHGAANTKEQLEYATNLGFDATMSDFFYDTNRPTSKYSTTISTTDGGGSWSVANNRADNITVTFDTTNTDLRFMIDQVPRNWIVQLNATIEIDYVGLDDVMVKAFYDKDTKNIRTKIYHDGVIKNVGDIPNGEYVVTIII